MQVLIVLTRQNHANLCYLNTTYAQLNYILRKLLIHSVCDFDMYYSHAILLYSHITHYCMVGHTGEPKEEKPGPHKQPTSYFDKKQFSALHSLHFFHLLNAAVSCFHHLIAYVLEIMLNKMPFALNLKFSTLSCQLVQLICYLLYMLGHL